MKRNIGVEQRLAWLLAGIAVFGAVACSDPTNYPTRMIRRPVGMAVTCKDDLGALVPVADCSEKARILTGWVADADQDSVAILNLGSGRHEDTNTFIPGFTSLNVGHDLVAIRALPSSEAVFALLRQPREVLRIDPTNWSIVRQPLPCMPEAIEVVSVGPWSPDLLVTCPDLPGLVRVPLDGFGTMDPGVLSVLQLPGSPRYAALSPDGTWAFVTHLRHPVLDRVDLASGIAERIGLTTACADGLDNDGDGKTDAADSGCFGPTDDDESDDRLSDCQNGVDDDGDGLTDMADPDCPLSEFSLANRPICGNGVDDDGDGLTDAPADPDCYGLMGSAESQVPGRLAGRPAVTADGVFVYVPLIHPAGIAVVQTNPLSRVSINAPEGPSPNALLERLGFRDLLVPGPPAEVLMHATDAGNLAFLALQSGQILKATVDEAGQPRHRLVLQDDPLPSAATSPVLRVGGIEVDRALSLHPEYPSFGAMTVSLVSGTSSTYSYYGIRFNGNADLELTETWKVTYEGRLPGAEGLMGLFSADRAQLLDPTADFCAAGVMPDDHVVLTPDQSLDCGDVVGERFEYAITDVAPGRLQLSALDGGAPLPGPGCLPSPIAYEVRPTGAWTVVGARSGFLHDQIAQGDACVTRAVTAGGFTGRAYTSLPKAGVKLSACPPLDDSPDIDWRDFTNVAFTFDIVPPCEQDLDFNVTVLPVSRDTELSFSVIGGLSPITVGIGGMPVGLQIVGSALYALDQAVGVVHVLDPDDLSLVLSHY